MVKAAATPELHSATAEMTLSAGPAEPTGTAVVKPTNNFVTLKNTLNSPDFQKELRSALPSHLTPERMARVAYTSYVTTPALQECAIDSIRMCVMEAAQLGLEPNGVTGLAYLVPFENKKTRRKECQLMLGYKGKIELARRSGQLLAIWAEVVYEKDVFEVQYGLHPDIKHKKFEGENPGPLTHAYAVAIMKDTTIRMFAVLNRREVMKRKSASRAATSDYSPWAKWEEAMWIKSAIHALGKLLPMSVEYREAFEKDELREIGKMQGNDVIEVDATSSPVPNSLDEVLARAGAEGIKEEDHYEGREP